MPKNLNRRLTAAEFQACAHLAQQTISADRVAAARSVLVDGDGPTEVARRYAWTRQAVGRCVDKLWEIHENYQTAKRYEAELLEAALPPGWRVATVAAPEQVLVQLRADVDAAAAIAGIPVEHTSI